MQRFRGSVGGPSSGSPNALELNSPRGASPGPRSHTPTNDYNPSGVHTPLPRSPSPTSRQNFFGLGLGLPLAEEERRALTRKASLPLYANNQRQGARRLPGSSLLGKRNPRLRWLAVVSVLGLIWYYTRVGSAEEQLGENAVTVPPRAKAPIAEDNLDRIAQLPNRDRNKPLPAVVPLRPPAKEVLDDEAPARVAPQPIAAHQPAKGQQGSASPIDLGANGPVDISVWPTTMGTRKPRAGEKFLAYSSHSGYNNQRISLENALTLAHLLGRTLLLPPVWLGHAIPYIRYDKLGRRLQMANKEGLDRCKEIGEGGSGDPIPRECLGYWDWTLAHWSFIVDMEAANKLVPTMDRVDQTDEWMVKQLGLGWKKDKTKANTYELKDETMYDHRFYDALDDLEPLSAFKGRLDLGKLRKDSANFKLVQVGSLFGTSRLRVTDEENWNARSAMRQAMISKNPLLEGITNAIRDRLGGPGRYFGLHLRVGDGIFQENAVENMRTVWDSLCAEKMKLEPEVCRKAAALSAAVREGMDGRLARRDVEPSTTEEEDAFAGGVIELVETTPSNLTTFVEGAPALHQLTKRKNSRPQKEGAYHHAPLPPLPKISSASDMWLDPSLSCRRALHTDPDLLKFNAPLFIATDSKQGASDPRLALFTHAFPCTFVLNDFGAGSPVNTQPVPELATLAMLRNAEDKVPLAGFLFPHLDAMVAAWGRHLVGTPMSTFSRFACDVLHQVYHGWDSVERG